MALDLPPAAELIPFPTEADVAATLDSRYPQVTINSPGPDVIRDAVVAGASTQELVLAMREALTALDRVTSAAATAARGASSTAGSALTTAQAASQDAATAADAAIAAQTSAGQAAVAAQGAYRRPSGGIPATDLALTARQDLTAARTAVQPGALAAYVQLVDGVIPAEYLPPGAGTGGGGSTSTAVVDGGGASTAPQTTIDGGGAAA